MDLTTLPMEMSASIAKYLTPNDLLRLRKTNVNLDTIAKRYGLRQRIGVDKFEIWKTEKFYFNLELDEEFIRSAEIRGKNKRSAMLSCDAENMMETLAQLAERTVLTTSLELFYDFPIDVAFLRMVKTNKPAFKKFQSLILIEPLIAISIENLKLLMRCFPKLDSIEIITKESCAKLLNAEVLGYRTWSSLKINYDEDTPQKVLDELNDQFLCEVVSKFESFYLEAEDLDYKFTINGVVNMMQIILSEPASNRDIQLNAVHLGGLKLPEVSTLLAALPGVTTSNEEVEPRDGFTYSKIYYYLIFGEDENSSLAFMVKNPIDNSRKRKASKELDDF